MKERGKSLEAIESIRQKPGSPVYVRQQEPLGLGHAVWCAREIVGDEPFAVFLPDELMVGTPGFMKQMRSEEHTSELQSLMRISYAVFCLKKKIYKNTNHTTHNQKTIICTAPQNL